MNLKTVALAAVLSLGTACASTTQSSSAKPATTSADSPGATGQAAVAKDKRTEMICESVKEVGSNIPTRICKTRGQLAEEAEMTQQQLNTPVNRPAGGN